MALVQNYTRPSNKTNTGVIPSGQENKYIDDDEFNTIVAFLQDVRLAMRDGVLDIKTSKLITDKIDGILENWSGSEGLLHSSVSNVLTKLRGAKEIADTNVAPDFIGQIGLIGTYPSYTGVVVAISHSSPYWTTFGGSMNLSGATFNNVPEHMYRTSSYSSDPFQEALTAAQANDGALVVDTQEVITSDKTVPTNVMLWIFGKGSLSVSTTKTITINGPFSAALKQVFYGVGEIVFGSQAVKEVYPQWWGAKGDGANDDAPAVQKAIDCLGNGSGGKLFFTSGIFRVNSQITVPQGKAIHLAGSGFDTMRSGQGTEIRSFLRDGTNPAILLYATPNSSVQQKITDLMVTGGDTSEIPPGFNPETGTFPNNHTGIKIKNVHRGVLRNITVMGFKQQGIHIDSCFYWDFENIHTQYNWLGVRCKAANASFFRNINCHYNTYGIANSQHILGGAIEGNYRSGVIYDSDSSTGMRSHLKNIHFESNHLGDTEVHAADIYNGKAGAILLTVESCWFSHLQDRTVESHVFYGKFQLVILGAIRFFNLTSWKPFYFLNLSQVQDYGNNNMQEITGPVSAETGDSAFYTFTGVGYCRPHFNNIFTFEDGDTTPSIGRSQMWKTANMGATTITSFGDLTFIGQKFTVYFGDALTTIDFTGTALKGNAGVDWSPAQGDHMVCTYIQSGVIVCECFDNTA